MNDDMQGQPNPEVVQEAPATAGALLRQARERAGIHIGALAVNMRVPLKKLELLEADRYEELPDATFARALASSVCRTLKIDPEPILTRLPQTDAPRLKTDGSGINVPFQRPNDLAGASWWSQLPKPVVATVLLLLTGILVVLFMPEIEPGPAGTDRSVASQPAPVPPLPGAAPEPESTASAAIASPVPVTAAVPPLSAGGNAPAQHAAAALPAAPPGAAPAAKPAEPAAPGRPASAAVVSPAGGVLVFKTRGTSWVEVTDAQGTVLLRRNLEAGENVGVSGNLPLAVVIGRADATDVWVRGKPFALHSVSSENVARFEVRP